MNLSQNIIIETGNPFGENAKAASYTRFILPFAYEIQGQKNAEALLKWEKVESNDLSEIHWRKQYFTSEVADVLFEKAKWYVLRENGYPFARSFTIKDVTEKKPPPSEIPVIMNPPQLVLFQKESKSKFLNIGFLILEIYFPDGKKVSLDDLLFVNENLRYKEQIFEGHREKICNLFPTPNEVEKLCPQNESNKIKHYFDFWHYLLQQPVNAEGYLVKIEPSIQNLRPSKDRSDWDIYADARTFVWTCAVTEKGAEALQDKFYPTSSEKWGAHNYGHWIKLLNVDKPSDSEKKSHEEIRQFERDWAKERTYHRWEEWGTYYGFSYHSGAAIIPPFNDAKDTPKELNGVPLWKHWGAMYFDTVLLLFYLRVTLFRFSSELTKISSEAICETNKASQIESWREKFNDLRWEFTLFTNLYQYPLISNQQQGLEMYELARKSLDINELFKEIQDEIQNGQEFIEQELQRYQSIASQFLQNEQSRQSRMTSLLTIVATVGLVASVAISFWSGYIASPNSEDPSFVWQKGFSGLTIITLITIIATTLIIKVSPWIEKLMVYLIDWFKDKGK